VSREISELTLEPRVDSKEMKTDVLEQAAQSRGMYWALAFRSRDFGRGPHHRQKIHSVTGFNVKVLAWPFSIFLLIVGFLALSTLRNDSRTGS